MREVVDERLNGFYLKTKKQVESVGYHLNPDVEFSKSLLKSILINQDRYGYGACPCRLASGVREEDLDIICPCDYRDPDLEEYNACYCGLYVSGKILKGEEDLKSIPERRPAPDDREKLKKDPETGINVQVGNLPLPVWRCTVCGYLCARENPPEICPICKVDKERFERFM